MSPIPTGVVAAPGDRGPDARGLHVVSDAAPPVMTVLPLQWRSDGGAGGTSLRPAAVADVPQIERLMAPFVAAGDLLPRGGEDLRRHIAEYIVAQHASGLVVGCGSLKRYGPILGEIAGLAVHGGHQRSGIGHALVDALVHRARALGMLELLALTRKPAFFERLGFVASDKAHFPLKVWADCLRCPRREHCDEIAVSLKL